MKPLAVLAFAFIFQIYPAVASADLLIGNYVGSMNTPNAGVASASAKARRDGHQGVKFNFAITDYRGSVTNFSYSFKKNGRLRGHSLYNNSLLPFDGKWHNSRDGIFGSWSLENGVSIAHQQIIVKRRPAGLHILVKSDGSIMIALSSTSR